MQYLEEKINSRLLRRQIQKHLSWFQEQELQKMERFFSAIEDEYRYEHERREMLEWTVRINSAELSDKNTELSKLLEKNIQANTQLKQSKRSLKIIIDNLGEGLIVVNKQKQIVELNQKALSLCWIAAKKLLWKKYDSHIRFVSDNPNIEIKDFIASTLSQQKENILTQHVILSCNDVYIPVFVSSTPLPWDTFWEGACIVVFRDASRERELDRLKNEFLSVASHELRTPMTVIKWYISLFLQWKFWDITEKQKWFLDKIYSSVWNLLQMVNDMLDVNKLEAGQMDFIYEKANISQLVQDCITEMKDLFRKKHLHISSQIDDVVSITDTAKLKQVIINYLSNAYKFTKKNWSIRITVTKDITKSHFCIAVQDSGIWIKKEDISKLFKKFSQVWSHLNKTEKGTGLGLSICKQITEWMWGSVTVESVYWEGSTFSLVLPYKRK